MDFRDVRLQRCHHATVPRVKSDEQRGYVAAWMRREREARGWSQKEMADRLATVGYAVDPVYYRQIEAGPRKPGPDFLHALERLYGSSPEPLPEPVTEQTSMSALIVRLDRQAAAIESLSESVTLLAAAVGQQQQVTMAAADGMTSSVHVAIQSALDTLLSRLSVLPDTQESPRQTPVAARP